MSTWVGVPYTCTESSSRPSQRTNRSPLSRTDATIAEIVVSVEEMAVGVGSASCEGTSVAASDGGVLDSDGGVIDIEASYVPATVWSGGATFSPGSA